jgi:hypothetical protein
LGNYQILKYPSALALNRVSKEDNSLKQAKPNTTKNFENGCY